MLFRGSREWGSEDWSQTIAAGEMDVRLGEMLRQERERVAALTDAERAREDAERERQMNELVESMHKASNDFMQALLAAQERAAKEGRDAGH